MKVYVKLSFSLRSLTVPLEVPVSVYVKDPTGHRLLTSYDQYFRTG